MHLLAIAKRINDDDDVDKGVESEQISSSTVIHIFVEHYGFLVKTLVKQLCEPRLQLCPHNKYK